MKTTPKKKTVAKKRVAEGAYTATLDINEQKFTGVGPTAYDAMLALEVPTFLMKTKAVISLFADKKESNQMFLALQLRRFRNSRVARAMWAKRLEGKLK